MRRSGAENSIAHTRPSSAGLCTIEPSQSPSHGEENIKKHEKEVKMEVVLKGTRYLYRCHAKLELKISHRLGDVIFFV